PFLRASDRPMAIACFLLLTVLPLPLLRIPFLRLCIAPSTSFEALREYFGMIQLRDCSLVKSRQQAEKFKKRSLVGVALRGSFRRSMSARRRLFRRKPFRRIKRGRGD